LAQALVAQVLIYFSLRPRVVVCTMAQTLRAEATTPAGPTLLTSKACRDEQADGVTKPDELIKVHEEASAVCAQQPGGADGSEGDAVISAAGVALAEITAQEQQPGDADDAEEEIAAEVEPLGDGEDLEAGACSAAAIALERTIEVSAEVSSDEEDDESNLSLEARQAAQAKAASDEAFWTAASLALHERERRERVGAFLKQHGFGGVSSSRGWWSYTYPLHVAAVQGDARLAQLLLDSRALRRRKDSSGQTARQLAKAVNKQGSHDAVIQVLKFSQRRRRRSMPLDTVFSGLPAAEAVVSNVEATQLSGPPRASQPAAMVLGNQEGEALAAELACEVFTQS